MQDPENLAGSYGRKQGDIRHRFVGVYSVTIPTGSFAASGWRRQAFGGWAFQGIVSARSGLPVNVLSGVDFVGNGRPAGQRPDVVSGADPYTWDPVTLRFLNAGAFDNRTPAAQRRFGNLGYNAFSGPSAFTYDAALHKAFSIRENQRLLFRFEMFNALNHTVFDRPNATLTSPNFGLILGANEGRNIQLALKYQF